MDSQLCLEMIIEILSRASLKTLDTMRCTNKELDTLTHNPYVLDLYKKRNNIVSGFLVRSMKDNRNINWFAPSPNTSNLDLGFLPEDARILATSEQGIIVFESPHPQIYYKVVYHVCKPATRQVWSLPNPKTSYLTTKVAIVILGLQPSLHYKILRLSQHKKEPVLTRRGQLYNTYCCEVFDSVKGKWRLLELLMVPFGVIISHKPMITTRGSVYMLLDNNEIWKFDVRSEQWTTFLPPIQTLNYGFHNSNNLVKYGGKLGFTCKPPNGFWELWVLNDGESWEKVDLFDENEDIQKEQLHAFYDLETTVSMCPYRSEIVYHRFKGKKNINKVVLSGNFWPRDVFFIRSDFETVDTLLSYYTQWGQSLVVCGSEPVLGSGNVKKGLLLTAFHEVDDAKNVLRWEIENKRKLVLPDGVENGKILGYCSVQDMLPKYSRRNIAGKMEGSRWTETSYASESVWQGDCLVPKGAFPLKYKYCKYGKNGNFSLENGSNREVAVDVSASGPTYLILSDGMMRFLDLKLVVDWAVDSGFHLLQLLPINDTSVLKMWWDSYPYSSLSVFALRPLYLRLQALSENIPDGINVGVHVTMESLLKDKELTTEIKGLVRSSARSYPGQEEIQLAGVANLSVVPEKQQTANEQDKIHLPSQNPKITSTAVL
ncbi:4-alpha-glucanotransferase DPE2 [Tanacetum coccineum]|uniref:4-alpha-glucanotransferase n=1 Tax=Tanacetum coccineum TaxID=301880 RepID=A0ABQ5H087_9ASTR